MGINVPPGMTEEQVMETINLVCTRVKNKYVNTYHEPDDVFQEAFLECVSAMDRYNSKHPLENFLMVNLHNRMINFRRKYTTREISTINLDVGEEPSYVERQNKLKMFEQIIDERLSVDMRHDYLKLKDGIKIPRIRKKNLYDELRRLANEHGTD